MNASSTPSMSSVETLGAYLDMGWALVPLHDVSAGACSCPQGGQCRPGSAGKHPRFSTWQQASQQIRDRTTLAALVAAHPGWNWGAATGRASGIWVLDYDPKNAGAEALELVRRIEGTRTHRTGSGGLHLIFTLDGVDWPIGNGRGRLPVGLDVRGTGGQIVLPGSVSGIGSYEIMYDMAPRPAPAWLLDLIRPLPAPERTAPIDVAAAGEGGREQAYATGAWAAVLQELRAAPVGTRNDTAYRAACRLHELVNAGWIASDQAHDSWWDAASAHPDGLHVPAAELVPMWRRAAAQVAGRAAVLPAEWGATMMPFLGPGPAAGSSASDGASAVAIDPVQALIDRMLTPDQLRAMPAPRPLVAELLDLDSCAWMIGEPGSYKTFVALDMAARIGRGEPWRGRAVQQGTVVWIAAEGARGMRLRVDAWEREYGMVKDLLVLPEPVQADERRAGPAGGAWSILVAAAARLRPTLVVIDTQSRVTIGLKENDNTEMAYYAEQADRIRRATGACVLTIHHIGRQGTNARGGSAIDGAQDAELRVKKCGSLLGKLYVDKQKELVEIEPIEFAMRRSDGGVDAETGRDLSSLVLAEPVEVSPFLPPEGAAGNAGIMRMIALYKLIFDLFNAGDGGTKAEIRDAFLALPEVAAMPHASSRKKAFYRAWSGTELMPGLVPRGLLAKRVGAEKFKIIVLPEQGAEGCLTPNPRDTGHPAPAGWNVYWPDDETGTGL